MLLYAGVTTNTRPRWGLNRRNIIYRNIRIWVEKKPIVSVTYENERISTKNSLPYIKCVLRLSCVVHGPIYGRLMDCTVNGTVNGLLYLKKKSALGLKRKRQPEIRLWNHVAWDHALSLLSLYVSHGKVFSLSSQRSKEAKKKNNNNAWSQVRNHGVWPTSVTGWAKSWLRAGCNLSCNLSCNGVYFMPMTYF